MEIPAYVQFVLDRLGENGYEGYLVGGCVRDALMGKTPADYDIAVSCAPEITEACFADCRVIETGLKHGTVTVVSDGRNLELTTFRRDGEYRDHRRPAQVTFTDSLTEDLSRRDFTVNAMAYNPETGLRDPFGGQADLRAGVLRAVGDPRLRFEEDALRILRALRFSAVLGFEIEARTAAAALEKRGLLESVSGERKFSELKKLLCGRNAADVLTRFRPVLETVLPPLAALSAAAYAAAADRTAGFDDPAAALAALLLPCGPQAAEDCCRALHSDNRFLQTCVFLIRFAGVRFGSRGEALRFAGAHGDRLTALLPDFRKKTGLPPEPQLDAALAAPDACRRIADLRISGRDLEKLGITGPRTGAVLSFLLTEVTEGRLPNSASALKAAAGDLGRDG